MNTILRVNTRTREVKQEIASKEMERWGGRGLIAHILLNEVPPTCNPVGRKNKLIFASGLFADTRITTSGQMSVGGKSPLTSGVKECNVGGFVGRRIANLGIKAIILEDHPQEPTTDVLVVTAQKAYLDPAPELKGKRVSETVQELRKRYGKKIGIFCIGPAGERMLSGAGVASPDDNDVQIRYAARGGLGAVAGSKGIKALVIDDRGSPYKPAYHDTELLSQATKWLNDAIIADPKTENRRKFGTYSIVALANSVGLLPTRNFSAGQFEQIENILAERIREEILKRGGVGKAGTTCVPGCIIQCSNVVPDPTGEKKIVASLQYENIVLLGPNCGIGNLDDIAELNHLCNEVGVDAIETGAAVGVAMEAGIVPFGDASGAKRLIREIGEGTYLGRILGHGAAVTGRILGVRRVPVVKNQAMPAYDPRALKGNGVTYVSSPMGADHTAGNAFETLKTQDPVSAKGQVAVSKKLQLRVALFDICGLCMFARVPFVSNPEKWFDLFKGRYGWELTMRDVMSIGLDTILTEREFNKRAGVSEEFFPIPEFMEEEPLPPTNAVFDVPMEEILGMWEKDVPLDQY